ncbi:GNAT family N-acetyltransferase [Celeribacter litoreus]|uniref:GNAT family N-acetyltransferase n=1 Tax=Celeribacter litoreus TaxID=2876714 RepID=UPI001CCBE855|nr:GNAT family N-acetyltransferase [Celeribacter litoreus]MCA0045234.1 GNAT family N-acetyltransferase [Celeribacter litoreus]
MKLRPLTRKDSAACHRVFLHAVHEGAKAHYSSEQRAAWAPKTARPHEDWPEMITHGFAIGATRWGRIRGFFAMGTDGFIDLAYVHPSEMGKGTAGKLYDACENEARRLGLSHMETEASHLARRFFEKRGWSVTAQQTVIRNAVAIENFRMEKQLSSS